MIFADFVRTQGASHDEYADHIDGRNTFLCEYFYLISNLFFSKAK